MGTDSTKSLGTILFVDDKDLILESAKRYLANAAFQIVTARSGHEALKMFNHQTIDIVIADYKMPDMNGLEFLEIVRERFPSVRRSIGTGYMDELKSIQTISDNLVSNYFKKPWDYTALQQELEHLLEIKKQLENDQLMETLGEIGILPTLPDIYNEFIQAVEEGLSARDLASLFEKDAAVTANIIHIANSAFYGRSKTNSLERAIITLGFHSIQSILLILSMKNTFDWDERQEQYLQQFFLRVSLVNFCFLELHKQIFDRSLDRLDTSLGLLYDIGKVIILQCFPDRYQEIAVYKQNHPDQSFYEAEIALGYEGVTHNELGAYLLRWWNFSDKIVELALYHHTPEIAYEGYRPSTRVLAYADALVTHLLNLYPNPDIDFDSFIRDPIDQQDLEYLTYLVYQKIKQHQDSTQVPVN
ncbi:MAG TPA: HDOD domain-containing protein [bacterium]|nr:HDOD domain-containing protein [bacterium]